MERIPRAPDLHLGESLGPNTPESVLGEGTVGVVFKAKREDGVVVDSSIPARDPRSAPL